MLKRFVQEAARAATGSGGEASDRRRRAEKRKPASRRAAASSSSEEEAKARGRRTSDESDGEETKRQQRASRRSDARERRPRHGSSSSERDGDRTDEEEIAMAKAKRAAARRRGGRSSDDSDDANTSPATAKRTKRAKNTRKNTFSWDIAKAFARKQPANNDSGKSSSKAKKREAISEDSATEMSRRNTPRKSATKKKKKKKKRGVETSSDGDSETDARKTTRRAPQTPRRRRGHVSSSSEDSEPRRSKSDTRSSKSKREAARTESASTETDQEQPRATKNPMQKKKRTKTRAGSSASGSSAEPDRAAASSSTDVVKPHKKSKNSTKQRSERHLSSRSTRSSHKARPSRSPSKARSQRLASTSSARTKRIARNHSKARSRAESVARTRNDTSPVRRRRRASITFGDATSSAESASSGLDVSRLRKMKNHTRHHEWTGAKDTDELSSDVDDDEMHRQSRSDGEYDKHLKRSLRRAFDFFDLDQSDMIEKKELSHVLRALGHEFTSDELDAEMARADLDQNGQLDFHEFVAFVKRQLAQKQFMLSKRRETEIRQAFQSLDSDKNGVLDEKEFEYLIYKVLGVELSVEEQDALLDFVDENGDGNINESEFIAFMKVMESFQKAKGGSPEEQQHLMESLDGPSRLAMKAMKKLNRGAPVDLDRNLLMFFGVPSNFRPAISSASTVRALQANTLEHVLSFPSPQIIVALAQSQSGQEADKKGGIAFGSSARNINLVSDENALLQQAESTQAHAIVSLKRAVGVPKPFDTREEDVLKRCVHVCLFQEQEEHPQKSRSRRYIRSRRHETKNPVAGGGTVVGNVHEVPVHWHAGEEDVWEFSKKATKQDRYKFLVRTNAVNDHLYLLVEFIVHLRMAKREKRSRGGRKSKSASDRNDRNDAKAADDDSNEETREMVCCWCKIPVRTLLAKRVDVYRSKVKLWGGTAHAPVDIESDEILRRRTGWRAFTSVFKVPAPPGMGIKSTPVSSFPEELQQSVRAMPATVIVPFLSLPIVSEYMALMKSMLSSAAGSSSGVACEPVLKLLPRIIDDHEALTIFRRVFDAEMSPLKSAEERQNKFQELVLRMWPSQIQWQDRFPATLLAKISQPTPTGSSQAIGGKEPATAASKQSSLRTTVVQSSAQGSLRLQDLAIASAPFHVREVAFERVV